jgi:hypothetical protein
MPREASGLATLHRGVQEEKQNGRHKKTGGVTPPHTVREMTPPNGLPACVV